MSLWQRKLIFHLQVIINLDSACVKASVYFLSQHLDPITPRTVHALFIIISQYLEVHMFIRQIYLEGLFTFVFSILCDFLQFFTSSLIEFSELSNVSRSIGLCTFFNFRSLFFSIYSEGSSSDDGLKIYGFMSIAECGLESFCYQIPLFGFPLDPLSVQPQVLSHLSSVGNEFCLWE